MSVCRLNHELDLEHSSKAEAIDKTVAGGDAKALQSLIDEVNSSRLTDRLNCKNVTTLYGQLDPEAKQAVNVVIDNPEDRTSRAFLEMNNLWAKEHIENTNRKGSP
ncbi:MAG: hypothetical protein KC777_17240 [Cyanobacteria bacterium HKST-UBA02]|nr:hypothetical protein [Cyanobacteria bacterium HKST-UBA02]